MKDRTVSETHDMHGMADASKLEEPLAEAAGHAYHFVVLDLLRLRQKPGDVQPVYLVLHAKVVADEIHKPGRQRILEIPKKPGEQVGRPRFLIHDQGTDLLISSISRSAP